MEWRYGWSADDPRWSEEQLAGEPSTWTAPGSVPSVTPSSLGNGGPPAWQQEAWGTSPQRPSSFDSPVNGMPYGNPSAYGNGTAPPPPDPRVTTGGLPALRGPSGQHIPVRPGFGLAPPPPPPPTPHEPRLSTGRAGARRRPAFDAPGTRFADEPRYSVLFALTAGWYTLPAALYFVWLITIGTNRVNASGGLAASVPWLAVSLVLSLVVAGLLRWAIVGWRAMTLSFAAAVIGAGVATIAHSLSI